MASPLPALALVLGLGGALLAVAIPDAVAACLRLRLPGLGLRLGLGLGFLLVCHACSNPRFVCALPCAAVAALLRWPGVTVDGLAWVTGASVDVQ